jgi:hypothetical protein
MASVDWSMVSLLKVSLVISMIPVQLTRDFTTSTDSQSTKVFTTISAILRNQKLSNSIVSNQRRLIKSNQLLMQKKIYSLLMLRRKVLVRKMPLIHLKTKLLAKG